MPRKSFSYELPVRNTSFVSTVLSSLPCLVRIVTGILKHPQPRDKKILPNTNLVLRGGVTTLDEFIKTDPGTFEEKIDSLTGILTGEYFPGAIKIEESYSNDSEVMSEVVLRLANFYLAKSYSAVLHFYFGTQDREYFRSIGKLELFYDWEIAGRKINELHFEFDESSADHFVTLLGACKSVELKEISRLQT